MTIAYSVSGTVGGPAVVLMPGVPFCNLDAEWRIPVVHRAFTRLGERVRLGPVRRARPGRSQRDVDDLSLDAMLRDLDAVVDAAGASRASSCSASTTR